MARDSFVVGCEITASDLGPDGAQIYLSSPVPVALAELVALAGDGVEITGTGRGESSDKLESLQVAVNGENPDARHATYGAFLVRLDDLVARTVKPEELPEFLRNTWGLKNW